MKKILPALFGLIGLLSPVIVNAQAPTFTVAQDTVYATIGGTGEPTDYITDTAYANGLVVRWHVLNGSDFPADWLTPTAFGICDNYLCRFNTGDTVLWNSATSSGSYFTSSVYHLNAAGAFYLDMDLSSATTMGTHWITVALKDTNTIANYTKNITFVINKVPVAVPVVSNAAADIVLYPNPADNELNVVYGANADIKNIAVYNIIGKVLAVYKVAGSGANLNLENIPSGIYFVRLCNSNGNVVATRKFTKQ